MTERLWAPWRSVYIGKDQEEGCVFCSNLAAGKDAEKLILYRGDRAFVMMNLYPYNNGHLMVAPVRHVGDITDLDQEEMLELMAVTRQMVAVLRKAFNPHGFNIGINMGRVAGAGVPGHLHIHIVPRWNGDTNFMPVLGDVKVISEGLDETYKKIDRAMHDQ